MAREVALSEALFGALARLARDLRSHSTEEDLHLLMSAGGTESQREATRDETTVRTT